MRQQSSRLHIVLLTAALAWQGPNPTGAEGQELPHPTSVEAQGLQTALGPRLSLDASAGPGNRIAGGLAGALVGTFAGALIGDGVGSEWSFVEGAVIGEAIGLPLGVYFSTRTTPRGRVAWALLASSAIAGIAFVAAAEADQPAILIAAVPLQLVVSLHLIR